MSASGAQIACLTGRKSNIVLVKRSASTTYIVVF